MKGSNDFRSVTLIILIIEVFAAFESLCSPKYYNGFNITFSLIGAIYFLVCSVAEKSNLISSALFFANLICHVPNFFFLISQLILFGNVLLDGRMEGLYVVSTVLIIPEALLRFISNFTVDKLISLRHIVFMAAFLAHDYRIYRIYKESTNWATIQKEIMNLIAELKEIISTHNPLTPKVKNTDNEDGIKTIKKE